MIQQREHVATSNTGVVVEAIEMPRGRVFEVRFTWKGDDEDVHEIYHAHTLELARAVASVVDEQLRRWPGRCPDPRAIAKSLKERRHVAAGHKRMADGAVLLDTPRDELRPD